MTSRGPLNTSAVVVSGGKQYRVTPGDRILVDRLEAEPGASVKLDRVLLFSDGNDIKVGAQATGLDVDAKVIAHRRGPRIESIRYKSKKRVRVHRGGRAYLTALEIIAVGGVGLETEKDEEVETKAKPRGRAKAAPRAGRAQGAPDKKRQETKAEVAKPEPEKKPARRRTTKKEAE